MYAVRSNRTRLDSGGSAELSGLRTHAYPYLNLRILRIRGGYAVLCVYAADPLRVRLRLAFTYVHLGGDDDTEVI